MIDDHQFCQIQDLYARDGLRASQSASVLDLDPKTVAYGLAKSASGLEPPRRARANSIRLSPRFANRPCREARAMLETYP